MQYQVPKIVESNPVVMGLDVRVVLTVVLMALLFLFVVFAKPLIALIFPVIAVAVVKIKSRFKRKGEFKAFLAYNALWVIKMKKIKEIIAQTKQVQNQNLNKVQN